MPNIIIICRSHILYSYKISFSGITPANATDCDEILERDIKSRGTIPSKFWRPLLNLHKMAPQKGILRTFCHLNNASFHPLPGDRFPWNLNAKRESAWWYKLLEQNFEIFSKRDPASRVAFFRTNYRFRDIGVQKSHTNFGNLAKCRHISNRLRHQVGAHGGRAPAKIVRAPAKITGLFMLKQSKKTKWKPCVVCSIEAGADGWVTLTLIPAVTRLTA